MTVMNLVLLLSESIYFHSVDNLYESFTQFIYI